MTEKACPDQQVLEQLLLGRVAAEEAAGLEQHLSGCDLCTERAGELTGTDELTAAMRAKQLVPVDDGRVTDLIERLRDVAADAETSRLSETRAGIGSRSAVALSELTEFLDPPQQPDEIGRIGEYRVLEVLGVGGMGIVLQAEDPHLKRPVAIKVMKGDVAEEESSKSRFIREARTTAAIEHDNIVTIYQVAEHRGMPYYAMQFLRGESLEDRLKRAGALDQSEVLRIGREIAEGLVAAHSQGLLHRDIKPDNIWLEEQSDRAKIVDFGLARDAQDDENITMTGAVLGTPRYMAPEQALGKPVDGRCDLFSLGCVMYHLATGRPPFAGENLAATLMAVINKQPQPITQSQPNLDPELVQIIDRLLAKDPGARFQSADGLVEAIRRIERRLDDQRRRAVEKPRSQPTRAELYLRSQRRRRVMIGTAVVAGLLAIVFGVIFVIQTQTGTVRVEVNDDSLEVLIDGEKITLVDKKGERRKRTAKHQLAIKLGDQTLNIGESTVFKVDGHDVEHQLTVKLNGFDITSNEFEVVRGDMTVVKISLARRSATLSTPVDANAPPPAIAPFDEATAKQHQKAWADYLGLPVEKEVDLPGGEKMAFMLIPPGEFMMGAGEQEYAKYLSLAPEGSWEAELVPAESPQHRVRITRPFWLSRCEVTRGNFRSFANDVNFKTNAERLSGEYGGVGYVNGEEVRGDQYSWRTDPGFRQTDEHPVVNVSWLDAMAFCKWLEDRLTGTTVSLPTEAQWEYACRAGTDSCWFPGNEASGLRSHFWHRANSESTTHSVGQLKSNAWSLFDMHGNAWEWCRDIHASYSPSLPISNDPYVSSSGFRFVIRGGAFDTPQQFCRSAFRNDGVRSFRTCCIGYRVAMSIDMTKRLPASSTVAESSPRSAPPLAIAPFEEPEAKAHQKAWADYLGLPVEKEVDLPGGEKMSFMLIPPGEFLMGSSEEEQTRFIEKAKAANDTSWGEIPTEGPQHQVRITQPYYLGKYEVTQAQWQAVMGSNPSHFKDDPAHPVEQVSRDDTQPFLAKLNDGDSAEKTTFALPKEAQWEFACRAGTTTPWHSGDSEEDLGHYGWFNANAKRKTHPVGQLLPNAFGLYDLHGNVWEMCADWFGVDYYAQAPVNDPRGPSSGAHRVARGGDWTRQRGRSADRGSSAPDHHHGGLGFRLAMTIDSPKLNKSRPKSAVVVQTITPDDGWVDLLAAVDVSRDTSSGGWWIEDGELVGYGEFDLPIRPVGNFEWEIEFTAAPTDKWIAFHIPHPSGRPYAAVNLETGLLLREPADSEDWTRQFRGASSVALGERHTLKISRVIEDGKTSIVAEIDGKPWAEWAGDSELLATRAELLEHPRVDTPLRLITVHSSRLRMLDGEASLLRPVDVATPDAPGPPPLVRERLFFADGHPVRFTHDGRSVLMIHNADGRLAVLDAQTGAKIRLADHGMTVDESTHVSDLAVSPVESLVAGGNSQGQVVLWDYDTGELRHEFKGHAEGIANLEFTSDGKQLLSISRDRTIRVWDVLTGEQRQQFDLEYVVPTFRPWPFRRTGDTSPNAPEQKLSFRDFPSREVQWTASFKATRIASSMCVFSGDGGRLAMIGNVPGQTCLLALFDTRDGREIWKNTEIPAPLPAVKNLRYLANDRCLLSAHHPSEGAAVCLWDAATGQLLQRIDGAYSADVSPDGKSVVTLGPGSVVRIWRLDEQNLAAALADQATLTPASPSVADPDRRAAEYIVSVGGLLMTDRNDQWTDVIPEGPFRLTGVDLSGKPVTDEGLAAFRGCSDLETLNLSGTGITNAGVVHFKDCKKLTVLNLGTKVTNEGLAHFRGCDRLESLTLTCSTQKITDAGLAQLKDWPELQSLILSYENVTDAGMAHLKDCQALTNLNLAGMRVTDVGIAHLKECKGLTSIRIARTPGVSREMAEELKQALPNCKVAWTPAP